MSQQSLNNGEEEKTVDAVSAQAGDPIPKGMQDSEALSLFVACEGQALDMYRENFGVTIDDSLLHPMSDGSRLSSQASDKLNPLAALDAVINSFPSEVDSDRIVMVDSARSEKWSQPGAEPLVESILESRSDLNSPAPQSASGADDELELSGRDTYAGLPIYTHAAPEKEGVKPVSERQLLESEATLELKNSWQDDLVIRLEKNQSSSRSDNPGSLPEAQPVMEALPQSADFEFEGAKPQANDSWQDDMVFPLRRETAQPESGADMAALSNDNDADRGPRAEFHEEAPEVDAEEADEQVNEGGPKWASLTVSPSSRKWTDDESKNMEAFFLGIVSDKIGVDPAAESASSELQLEDSFRGELESFNDQPNESLATRAEAVEESDEELVAREHASRQSGARALEMFGLDESENESETETETGIVLEVQQPVPEAHVPVSDVEPPVLEAPQQPVSGAAKLDQAIDMFEDFLESGDAISLIAELGVTPAGAADAASADPKIAVDHTVLDKAIDMLEESLFEEAQVSARIFEALQARRLGNSLQKTEANWVIPMDRPLVEAQTDSWVFPAISESYSTDAADDHMVSPAPPLGPESAPGADSISGVEASVERGAAAPSEPASEAGSPRDSMAGIPLRPNFTIVSNEDPLPIFPHVGDEEQQQLILHPEDNIQTASGMFRAVQSLEQARELSIDSDNFLGLQDAAFGGKRETAVPKESKEDLLKTGERSLPRPSQEFLRIKSEDFSNPQELSQKLRTLPLPSAEEKREKDKELTPREMLVKYWSPVRGAWLGGLVAVVIFLVSQAKTSETYFALGKAEYDKGHYAKAMESFKSALALNPQSLPAIIYMGRSLSATHQSEAALERFALILKYEPLNWDALEGRAAIYASRTEWLLALNDLRSMVVSAPGRMKAEQWVWYGTALAGSGDQLGAADAFSMAVKLDPGSREARIGRLRSLRKAGKISEAIAESNRFLESSPKDRDARLELSRALIDRGEFRATLPVLQSLAQGHLRDSAVHYELGRAYAGLNEEQNAIREFDLALRVRPALAADISSERLKLTKRIEEARRDALARGGGYSSSQVHPLMLEMAREQQGGRSSLRREASSSSSDYGSYGSYGDSSQGETSAAVRGLYDAVKSNPSDINTRRRLAHALAAAKRPDEAARHFDEIWRASAWSAEDELALADSYSRAHKLDASINSYQKIVSSTEPGSPLNSVALYKQAQNLFLTGMKLQAAQYCRQGEQQARDGDTRNRFSSLLRKIESTP